MIHEQAIIEPGAVIGNNVSIGPWTIIGKDVEIGDNTVIHSHVVVKGPTKIGKNNQIFQFCSIGEDCQDQKYAGEKTQLIIGDNNIIREYVSIHRGTVQDEGITKIGNDNLLLTYCHVAHDCVIGNHVILSSNVLLAGHVKVDDWAILSGRSGVHQYTHIGAHAFVAANGLVLKDVPPYVMAAGTPVSPYGLNSEGLKRRGFKPEVVTELKRAYRALYRKGYTIEEASAEISPKIEQFPQLQCFVDFITHSNRGIMR